MRVSRVFIFPALIFAASGFAQQTVYWGDEGVEPRKALQVKGSDLFVMVTAPNAPLLADYRLPASQVGHRTSFREVFKAYREDAGKQFYLVRTNREPAVWGWIDRKSLLSNLEALRSEDKNNPTFIKAALRNNLQVDVSEKVDLRSGPGPAFGVVETNGLAQILYVYDQKKGTNGVDYLLLGWDALWDPERPSDTIRGWVRKDQCTLWDHRVAVYYNRKNIASRKPVSIFRTPEALKAFQTNGDTSGAVAVETPNSDKALTYDRSRFPVLQYGDRMKIAYIGAPPRDLKITVDKSNVISEQIRNIQTLFLIDGTISMGRYFKEVQNAVRDYIASLPVEEKARHHFAVAVYGDYEDAPKGRDLKFVADFDDPAAMEKLGALPEYSDPSDTTLEEAVFNGIIGGVKRASWKPTNLKVVVVIGDDPNHSPDTDRNHYSPQSVVKALKDFSSRDLESGFRFSAINVNVSDKTRRLNDEFVDQMKQIGNQFKPAGLFTQVHAEQGDLDRFRQAVTSALRNTIKTSEGVDSVVQDAKKGLTANQLAARYGTELTNLAINLLAEAGVKPDILDQSHISQISQEGWVQMFANGQQQMEPWVYIERTEMEEFKGFLASLLRSSDKRTSASQIVKEAVTRANGDQMGKDETIADYVKRAFAIPFREDSTILSKTPEQLQQSLSDQGYWSQFRKRVGYSLEALELVSANQDPSILKWDEAQNKWVRTTENPPKVQSWVTTNGGTTFCWIPQEYIP